MTFETAHRSPVLSRRTPAPNRTPGWLAQHRSVVIRHAVINFFNLIILLPLAWVLLMSVKSLPDAMRGDFWPKHFDFTHYAFVFHRIATLPINLFNSIYVTAGTVFITTACAV